MDFNQIDTALLKNSILQCIDSINHSSSDKILSGISNPNIWNTNSKNNFRDALEKIINTNYKKLDNKLTKLLESVDVIEDYKKTNEEISSKKELVKELMIDYEKNKIEIDNLNIEIESKEVDLLKIKNKLETYLD